MCASSKMTATDNCKSMRFEDDEKQTTKIDYHRSGHVSMHSAYFAIVFVLCVIGFGKKVERRSIICHAKFSMKWHRHSFVLF